MNGLSFGYRRGIPSTGAAWGARLIVRQDGYTDLPPDRSSLVGDDRGVHLLLSHLDAQFGLRTLLNTVSARLKDRTIDTRGDGEHVLFDDDTIRVVGSAQGSAGYFYVTAYLKEER